MEGTPRCSRRRLRMLSYGMRREGHKYVVESCVVHDGEIVDIADAEVGAEVEDLGNYLDTKISEKKGKLELSLEPERLGKLTIRLEYEKGKTEVTIFSTSAKTLEILSKEAGHLAQILEEKTGTPTVIYTPEQTENRQNMDQDPGHGRNGRQDQKEQRQKQDDSFAQQLRLGLA